MLAKRDQLLHQDLSHDIKRADEYITALELERDLSQTIIHLDCDAFYAAVEELDRPELKTVPMAVGRGVLTTCNYEARKFGCRSGMAGFVARKLCPHLIQLPNNFEKYSAKAAEVRTVLARYDPDFEQASMDEAYMNLTSYCAEMALSPWDAVQKLRAEIHQECGITVSAGIAANAKLAKIGSNKNKPNGQFLLPSDRQSIITFMHTLPVRKVNGVGRVFERELDAIGIKTVGDIYTHRSILVRLFGEKAFHFLIRTYLGLGRTNISPPDESNRKSVGTERTFAEIQGRELLREKLHHIAEELEGDLLRTKYKGRTLVLKIKLHTYEVISRQTSPPFAIHKKEDLEKFALPMLTKLESEYPNMRLRLLGLRCTHLASTAKTDVDFFGLKKRGDVSSGKKRKVDEDGWEVWPEAEFEDAAAAERLADLEEMEALSQDYENINIGPSAQGTEQEEEMWDCPVCSRPQAADERAFNEHIDTCLSRRTIADVVKEQKETDTGSTPRLKSQPMAVPKKKRGRPRTNTNNDVNRNVRQKAFFS